jgi:signal transduction histidine kinase
MQSVREEESIRIARELHDQLGSVLTGFKWDLEMLSEMLADTVAESRLQEARAKMQLMTHAIVDTVAFVRRISSELRPSILDLGVIEAIRWQAKQFQSQTGIPCVCVSSHDDVALSAEQATAVFRILQETLTNILRHAWATNVEIRAEHGSGEFIVSVADDGRGITPEASGGASLGLLGMQERAHLVGGSIQIVGVEGKGTTLTLRLPLADEIEHRESESPSSREYANEADSNSRRPRGSP